MDTWPQLLQLQLSSNSLVEVLLGPHSMQNLLHLDLSNNKLKALPPTLTDLKKLQSLVVTSNKLTALPEAVSACDWGLFAGFHNWIDGRHGIIGELGSFKQSIDKSSLFIATP